MNSGNASLATTEQLLSGVLHALEISDKLYLDDLKMILTNDDGTNMTSITWFPNRAGQHGSSSISLYATIGSNVKLLGSNMSNGGKHKNDHNALAVLGKRGRSRYVVFGGNPLCEQFGEWTANNEQMNTLVKNTIRWLAGKTGKDPITLRFAHLKNTNHDKCSRAWLNKNMPEVRYNGRPAQCNPKGEKSCCNKRGQCSDDQKDCKTDCKTNENCKDNLASGM